MMEEKLEMSRKHAGCLIFSVLYMAQGSLDELCLKITIIQKRTASNLLAFFVRLYGTCILFIITIGVMCLFIVVNKH